MVEVRYKCACMVAETAIQIVQRDHSRDVAEWLEEIVTPAIAYDHRRRAPSCTRSQMEYAKLPIDPGSDLVGGDTKPS